VFDFTQDQLDFRDAIRSFARTRLLPGYAVRGRTDDFPWPEYRETAKLGVCGIGLPEEYGGTGAYDFVSLGIALEELCYADIIVGVGPFQAGLAGDIVARFGSQEVKDRYLPGLISGDLLLPIALTEPDSGSDAAALKTSAAKVPNGYLLNGEKTSITLLRDGTGCIVYAREPGAGDASSVSAFMVDLDREGVGRGEFHDMGLNKLGRGWLSLQDVFVPDENLIGAPGKGFSQVMAGFDFSRAGIGLQCLAAARASLDEVSAYAKERMSFGRPLATYQGVSLKIAEHYTKLEAARWLCYWTLWLRATGQRHTAQASMAKWYAPRVAVDAIESALTLTGHVAWSDEMPHSHRLRDVMAFLIGDGTAEIQKLIIAREYIGSEVMPRR
jgi:cyclohexanecarboxyl-CoA dehydrogenase